MPYSPPDPERRRDRRIAIPGEVQLLTLRPDGDIVGGILDVSAGGIRFRVRPGDVPTVGEPGVLDVRITLSSSSGPSPTLRLTGQGNVVRVRNGAEGGSEVSVQFDAPLRVRDAFAPPGATADGGSVLLAV
jgi:hypothetical protein